MFVAALASLGAVKAYAVIKDKYRQREMDKALEKELNAENDSNEQPEETILNVYDPKEKGFLSKIFLGKNWFSSLDAAMEAVDDLPEGSNVRIIIHPGIHRLEIQYLQLRCNMIIESSSGANKTTISGKSLTIHSIVPDRKLQFNHLRFIKDATPTPTTPADGNNHELQEDLPVQPQLDFRIHCNGFCVEMKRCSLDNTTVAFNSCNMCFVMDCEFKHIMPSSSAALHVNKCEQVLIQANQFYDNACTSMHVQGSTCSALVEQNQFFKNHKCTGVSDAALFIDESGMDLL
jgi:hypothetical protein